MRRATAGLEERGGMCRRDEVMRGCIRGHRGQLYRREGPGLPESAMAYFGCISPTRCTLAHLFFPHPDLSLALAFPRPQNLILFPFLLARSLAEFRPSPHIYGEQALAPWPLARSFARFASRQGDHSGQTARALVSSTSAMLLRCCTKSRRL